MKKIYLLLSIFISGFCIAQNPIPNAGFDTYWPSSPGEPSGWTDSRDISQVSPGYLAAGWAAQGFKSANTFPAFITSSSGAGIPITTAYTNLSLYYKFTSVSSDILTISVSVRNASESQIGSGVFQMTSSVSNWTLLNIPIYYSGSNPHDVIITVMMNPSAGSGNPNVGSNFIIDNLSLSSVSVAVENVSREASFLQVFPNPAKGFVQIRNPALGGKTSSVQVTNILGQIVWEMKEVDFSESNPRLNTNDLQPGSYIVTVKQDDLVQTKRLLIE